MVFTWFLNVLENTVHPYKTCWTDGDKNKLLNKLSQISSIDTDCIQLTGFQEGFLDLIQVH